MSRAQGRSCIGPGCELKSALVDVRAEGGAPPGLLSRCCCIRRGVPGCTIKVRPLLSRRRTHISGLVDCCMISVCKDTEVDLFEPA